MHTQFDRLIDEFERELKSGDSPEIESYVSQFPAELQEPMTRELISLEIFYRVKRGNDVLASEYDRFGATSVAYAQKTLLETRKANSILVQDSSLTLADRQESEILTEDVEGLTPARIIGPYQLLEKIGEGGMGTVWLAEQEEPVKRRVAIKLIRPELVSADVIARFDVEKQALAMMDHQHIARVLDAGTTDNGSPYFVMELVEGVPITQYCDTNRLSVDERLKLFIPVCKAIQHAHQKGIFHRDLKPSNVLVAEHEGEAVPKVIDFGMAKATERDLKLTEKTMFTEFGRVIGTLQYMSPEQAELRSGDVDTRTDVYSLGVMLYELLSGSTPLDKDTLGGNALLNTLEVIREKDPPRPSDRLSTSSIEVTSTVSEVRRITPARLQQILQGDLDWVVMKALEKDRTRRYQTANDFAQDISNYLMGEGVTARPPSAWYQFRKFTKRNRGLVASLLTVGVVLIAGIVGTGYGLVLATQKASEAEAQKQIAEGKSQEARTSERLALREKSNAKNNENRAIAAEKDASEEAQRARDSEAAAKFQLANARWETNRALDARSLLHEVPVEYRDNFEWHFCNRRFQGSDITCYGHTGTFNYGGVYDVAFSPDGKRVASASGDKTIKIWDAQSGQEIATLNGHEDGVMTVAFSPDGARLASGGYDKTIRFWDAESGQEISTVRGHASMIHCVAFSPNGDRLVSACNDKTIKLWDAATGEELRTMTGHSAGVTSVAFSPDGQQIVSGSDDKTVRLWDSQTGQELRTFGRHNLEVSAVAFSPDGTRLVSTAWTTIVLWNAKSGEKIVTIGDKVHAAPIRCAAFSPDGTRFATGSEDATVVVWDADSGQDIATLCGHAKSVRAVAFSPDGQHLASGSADRTVKLWSPGDDNGLALKGHTSAVGSVAFSSDGQLLASGDGSGVVKIWDARKNEVLFTMKGHSKMVQSVSFSPDGKQLASAATSDRMVRLWNTQTGEQIAAWEGDKHWVRGVMFSPDGKQLASAGYDGMIKLWDVETHEETAALVGHRGGLYGIAYSPDGEVLASASLDRTVKLWNPQNGKEIATLRGHTERVRGVAFGPLGKRLASTGNDQSVRIWDVRSGKEIANIEGGLGYFFSVAFSPDGHRVAAAGADQTVRLWNAYTGHELMALRTPGGIQSVTFNPDGTRLAAAVYDGSIRIWNAETNHETVFLSGHKHSVNIVTFSVDGARIYSESDHEKLVWDVAAQKRIDDAAWEPPESRTNVSSDGRWFVTMESKNIVLVDLEYKSTPL